MRPEDPSPQDLQAAVAQRYAGLAARSDALSCGDALGQAAPRPGEWVVDLGCGRGSDLVRAAAWVAPRGHVVGVDATVEMVTAARDRTAGLSCASVLRGDLAAVPLPDGCANVVVSSCAINHAPDKAAVFREVRRLLRPGGRVVVADVVSDAPLPAEVREDPGAWAACYGGAVPEDAYLAAVKAAGLVEVRILRRTQPYEKGGASGVVRVRSITLEARAPRAEHG